MAEQQTQAAAVNTADQSTPPSEAVNNTQNTSTETVNSDANEIQGDKPKMKNFNGFTIPEKIYEDIRNSGYALGQKELAERYKKENVLKSNEDVENLRIHEEIMEQLGNVIKKGEKLTKAHIDEFVAQKHEKAKLDSQKKIEALENQIKELSDNNQNIIHDILEERAENHLKTSALKAGANPEMVDDFITIIKNQKRIKFDEDLKTPIVLTPDGNEPMYDDQGNQKSVEIYVQEELAKKPGFQKAATAGGAGGKYGKADKKEDLLFTPRKNPITIVSQSTTPIQSGAPLK